MRISPHSNINFAFYPPEFWARVWNRLTDRDYHILPMCDEELRRELLGDDPGLDDFPFQDVLRPVLESPHFRLSDECFWRIDNGDHLVSGSWAQGAACIDFSEFSDFAILWAVAQQAPRDRWLPFGLLKKD